MWKIKVRSNLNPTVGHRPTVMDTYNQFGWAWESELLKYCWRVSPQWHHGWVWWQGSRPFQTRNRLKTLNQRGQSHISSALMLFSQWFSICSWATLCFTAPTHLIQRIGSSRSSAEAWQRARLFKQGALKPEKRLKHAGQGVQDFEQ